MGAALDEAVGAPEIRWSGATPSDDGVATGLPWRSGAEPAASFEEGFFARDARSVARSLLGARLISTVEGRRTEAVVVETEAYLGPEDPASHAATRKGRTERNAAMFGPAGRAYVYRIYGMHWCLNVVTGCTGEAEAVLFRGIEPLDGLDTMISRRGGRRDVGSGPGRLCQALGVDGQFYGHDLGVPPLRLLAGWPVSDTSVDVTGRVGVREASDWPFRFLVRGSPGVSR